MADTTAPVLLGLDLPSVIDADAFGKFMLTARAADPGGEGVRSVIVYFDKWFVLVDQHQLGGYDRIVVNGWFTGDTFGDATPDTASHRLPVVSASRSGDYHITKVAVEDMAGNRTVYSNGQLQAMGINTTFELRGGQSHNDTTPPELRKLFMPTTIDLAGGPSTLFVAGEVTDDGGAGIASMSVSFDRALDVGVGLGKGFSIDLAAWDTAPGAPGQPVSFWDTEHVLTGETPSGTYGLTGVTLVDKAGNTSTYTAAQLKALGFKTELQVTGSSAPQPAVPTATLADAISDEGFVLAVASSAWKTGSDNSFELVVSYDPTESRYVGASLAGAASGTVTASVSENGTLGTLTIVGTGSFASGAGIDVTMAQLTDREPSLYAVKEFTVNGAPQVFPDAYPARDAVRGGDIDEDFQFLSDLIDGGAGYDTVRFSGDLEGATVTRTDGGVRVVTEYGESYTLANVERLAFFEDYVVFDQDGMAAQAWRLYRAAFDRAPDREGLGFWISQLEHGMSREALAGHFITSSEFGPLQSSSAFVMTLYHNVLDRDPDAAGLAYWTGAIDAGLSREQALVFFSDNPENLARVIAETTNGIEYTLW